MNPSDYEIMMRIFQKLGVDKNFFGEFIFVFSGGNFVQVRDNRVKKPDDVKKLLSQQNLFDKLYGYVVFYIQLIFNFNKRRIR